VGLGCDPFSSHQIPKALKMGMGRPGPDLEPGPYGLRAKLWGHGPAQSTICIWPHWPNGHNGLTHSLNITYIVNITLIMQWRWHQHIIIFNSVVNHHQQTLLQQQSWWYWYINNFIQFFHCSAAECHWIACLLALCMTFLLLYELASTVSSPTCSSVHQKNHHEAAIHFVEVTYTLTNEYKWTNHEQWRCVKAAHIMQKSWWAQITCDSTTIVFLITKEKWKLAFYEFLDNYMVKLRIRATTGRTYRKLV